MSSPADSPDGGHGNEQGEDTSMGGMDLEESSIVQVHFPVEDVPVPTMVFVSRIRSEVCELVNDAHREILGLDAKCKKLLVDLKSCEQGHQSVEGFKWSFVVQKPLFGNIVDSDMVREATKKLSACQTLWVMLVLQKDCGMEPHHFKVVCVETDNPFRMLIPMATLMEGRRTADKRSLRRAQIKFLLDHLFCHWMPRSKDDSRRHKCIKVKDNCLLTWAGHPDPQGNCNMSFWSEDHWRSIESPLPGVSWFAEVAQAHVLITEDHRKTISLNDMLQAVKQVKSASNVDDSSRMAPNRCIHRDNKGNQAVDHFTPMAKEKCKEALGKGKEKPEILIHFLQNVLLCGKFADEAMGFTKREEAHGTTRQGQVRQTPENELPKVEGWRIWWDDEKKDYVGDIIVIHNAFSPWFANRLLEEMNRVKFTSGEEVGSSTHKRRAVRVATIGEDHPELAVFKLGNDSVPVAAVIAARIEEAVLRMIAFLFNEVDKNLIQPCCPDGQHCQSWPAEESMSHDQVGPVLDSNSWHTDASFHHDHDKSLPVKQDGSHETISRDSITASMCPQVFELPSQDLMRVGTLCETKQVPSQDVTVAELIHGCPVGEKDHKKLCHVALKGRGIHLSFHLQKLEHMVKALALKLHTRLVITVRLTMLPHHGQIFKDLLLKENLTERRHNNCHTTRIFDHMSHKSTLPLMDAESSLVTDSDSEEAPVVSRRKRVETKMELPKLIPLLDERLVKMFVLPMWEKRETDCTLLLDHLVIQRLQEKHGLHLTVKECHSKIIDDETAAIDSRKKQKTDSARATEGMTKAQRVEAAAGEAREADAAPEQDKSAAEKCREEVMKRCDPEGNAEDLETHECGVSPILPCFDFVGDRPKKAKVPTQEALEVPRMLPARRLLPGDCVWEKDVRAHCNVTATDHHSNTWRWATPGDTINAFIIGCPGKNDCLNNCMSVQHFLGKDARDKDSMSDDELSGCIGMGNLDSCVGGAGGNETKSGTHGADSSTLDASSAASCGHVARAQDPTYPPNVVLFKSAALRPVVALFHPVPDTFLHSSLKQKDVLMFLGLKKMVGQQMVFHKHDFVKSRWELCAQLPPKEFSNDSHSTAGGHVFFMEPHMVDKTEPTEPKSSLAPHGRGEQQSKSLTILRNPHSVMKIHISKEKCESAADKDGILEGIFDNERMLKAIEEAKKVAVVSRVPLPIGHSQDGSNLSEDADESVGVVGELLDDMVDAAEDSGVGPNGLDLETELEALASLGHEVQPFRATAKAVMPMLSRLFCATSLRLLRQNVETTEKGETVKCLTGDPKFEALGALLRATPLPSPNRVCDVGTGHLLLMVAEESRTNQHQGIDAMAEFRCVSWHDAGRPFREKVLLSSLLMRLFGNVEAFHWFFQQTRKDDPEGTKDRLFGKTDAMTLASFIEKTANTGPGSRHRVASLWVSTHLLASFPKSLRTNAPRAADCVRQLVKLVDGLCDTLEDCANEAAQETLPSDNPLRGDPMTRAMDAVKDAIDSPLTVAGDKEKTAFPAMTVMADLSTVFEGQPWGDETEAVHFFKGHGGDQGINLFRFSDKEEEKAANEHGHKERVKHFKRKHRKCKKCGFGRCLLCIKKFREFLDEECSSEMLESFGLEKETIDGVLTVVDKMTKKPMGPFQVEHSLGCKLCIVISRSKLGRSLNAPKPIRNHVHPTATPHLFPANLKRVAQQSVDAFFKAWEANNIPDLDDVFVLTPEKIHLEEEEKKRKTAEEAQAAEKATSEEESDPQEEEEAAEPQEKGEALSQDKTDESDHGSTARMSPSQEEHGEEHTSQDQMELEPRSSESSESSSEESSESSSEESSESSSDKGSDFSPSD